MLEHERKRKSWRAQGLNVRKHYLDRVKRAILALSSSHPALPISVKHVRKHYNESTKNRSASSFYGRTLSYLYQLGILTRVSKPNSNHHYILKDRPALERLQP